MNVIKSSHGLQVEKRKGSLLMIEVMTQDLLCAWFLSYPTNVLKDRDTESRSQARHKCRYRVIFKKGGNVTCMYFLSYVQRIFTVFLYN